MADARLRLQITTALDNAGIKATKEQIEGLEKTFSKVNGNGSMEALANKLGRLPGPLGKITDLFGGLNGTIAKVGGTASLVIGAFKAGWDIGEWLQTHVIDKIFGTSDAIEEVKKKNRELQRQHEKEIQLLEYKQNLSDNAYKNAADRIDQESSHIDKMTQAWVKAARAKLSYEQVGMDSATQKLERERFEATKQFALEGDTEGAEQMNKKYDLIKAQMQGYQQIYKSEQELAVLEASMNKSAEKRMYLTERIRQAEIDLRQKTKERETAGATATSEKEYRELTTRANQRHYSAKMRLKKAREALEEFDANDQGAIQLATAEQQHQLLIEKVSLNIEKAALDYDKGREAHKRKLAEKQKSIQRAESDYWERLGQYEEDYADNVYDQDAKRQDIERDYARKVRDLEKKYNTGNMSDEDYDDAMSDIMESRESAYRELSKSIYNQNKSYARSLQSLDKSTYRSLETQYDEYDKLSRVGYETSDKILSDAYNNAANYFDQESLEDAVARGIRRGWAELLEMK